MNVLECRPSNLVHSDHGIRSTTFSVRTRRGGGDSHPHFCIVGQESEKTSILDETIWRRNFKNVRHMILHAMSRRGGGDSYPHFNIAGQGEGEKRNILDVTSWRRNF